MYIIRNSCTLKTFLLTFSAIILVASQCVSGEINHVSSGEFTVHYSKKVSPSLSPSLIESRQLEPSRFTTIADCGFTCTNTLECRTAVYNQLEKNCVMYRSNALLTDNLISSTEDDYVVVADAKSASMYIIHHQHMFHKHLLINLNYLDSSSSAQSSKH